jgi:hypothetical protein
VPDLPFAAIAAAVAGMLLWALKQFLGEGIKHVGSRFWPKAATGRGVIRRAELRRYQRQVAATFSRQALASSEAAKWNCRSLCPAAVRAGRPPGGHLRVELRGVKNPERFMPKALSAGQLSVFFDGARRGGHRPT